MADEIFDPNLYTRPPILDVPSAYSLGISLLTVVPAGKLRTATIRQAALGLRESVIFLGDAWTASLKYGPADRRAFDVVADASWRSLYYALHSVAMIANDPDDPEAAKLAQQILARFFPNRLEFTQTPYLSQWAHSDRLIKDFDAKPEKDEGRKHPWAKTIDELVKPRHLAFVRRAHAAYGEALNITKEAKQAPGGVREPKRRVELAIAQYVFALFASHPPADPKNEPLLRKALAPIDELRDKQERSPAPAPNPSIDPVLDPEPEPLGPPPEDPIPDIE